MMMMRIEFEDLMRFSIDPGAMVYTAALCVVVVMQIALTCWTMHLTPEEMRGLLW